LVQSRQPAAACCTASVPPFLFVRFYVVFPPCRVKGGAQVWAQATQGLQAAAAAVGQRRADAARRAAQARKMWQLLRARLRGDVRQAAQHLFPGSPLAARPFPFLTKRSAFLRLCRRLGACFSWCTGSPTDLGRRRLCCHRRSCWRRWCGWRCRWCGCWWTPRQRGWRLMRQCSTLVGVGEGVQFLRASFCGLGGCQCLCEGVCGQGV
jgi:hypothetical protein